MATLTIWKELHDSLVNNGQGDIKTVLNFDAVKASIRNILGTRKGERIFFPQFGSSLGDMVFEPTNQAVFNGIADQLKSEVEVWDNRVTVVGVDMKVDPDNNFVGLTVRFSLSGYAETFTTTITV